MHKAVILKNEVKNSRLNPKPHSREQADLRLVLIVCTIVGIVLAAAFDTRGSRSLTGSVSVVVAVWFGLRYVYLKIHKYRDEKYFAAHGKPRPLPEDWM